MARTKANQKAMNAASRARRTSEGRRRRLNSSKNSLTITPSQRAAAKKAIAKEMWMGIATGGVAGFRTSKVYEAAGLKIRRSRKGESAGLKITKRK